MAEITQKIGGRIKELRETRQRQDPRWTQEYLAREIDPMLSGSQISRYERGEVKPSDERLERIAEIFETTPADLYAGPVVDRGSDLGALSPDRLARIEREVGQILEAVTRIERAMLPSEAERSAGELAEHEERAARQSESSSERSSQGRRGATGS